MKKSNPDHTVLSGLLSKDLGVYLLDRDRKQEIALNDLAGKLSRLEDTVAAQGSDIRVLEALLKQPEMQKPFIDLAERFVTRFERFLEETVRENAYRDGLSMTRSEQGSASDIRRQNEREREDLEREKELRLQIARCRRKIGALLRTINRQGLTPGRQGAALSRQNEIGSGGGDTATAVRIPASASAADAQTQAAAQTPQYGHIAPDAGGTSEVGADRRDAQDSAAERMDDLRFHWILGRRAGEDLPDPQGGFLIRKGEAVSKEIVQKAMQLGLLDALTLSVYTFQSI